MKIKHLLSDIDGVIRSFPRARDAEIENKFNLESGILLRTAFDVTPLEPAICGTITDEIWRANIEKNLAISCGAKIAKLVIKEWSESPGIVDKSYLSYIDSQFNGIPISVLTNATTRLHQDLSKLGIQNHFFKIFNSAEIGVCKPNPKIFEYALHELRCNPNEILFIDDSLSNVKVAEALGFISHHYKSLDNFKMIFN